MSMNTLRPAIAMIELIFAIVIMGIVLMSAPMLINTSTKSTNVALQQEGINEAAARINMIMGYSWDENSVDDAYRPPILIASGDSALNKVGTTERRIGIPMTSQRTFIRSESNSSVSLNASSLTSDSGDQDDIDDFIGNVGLVFDERDDNDVGYVEKNTVNIHTAVSYIIDSPTTAGYVPDGNSKIYFNPDFSSSPGDTTNIKSITITLTSTDTANSDILDKNIVLRAFSCNIGGYNFEERGF